MLPHFNIFGFMVQSYGVLIVIGLFIANLIAVLFFLKKFRLNINDFIVWEAYTVLGAIIGAKLLYIITIMDRIDWSRIGNIEYLSKLMEGGFVFYGGLIFALVFMFLGSKLHHIDLKSYIYPLAFMIPTVHAFGRIGCFLAGCCYGIPSDSCLSVLYPANSHAPSEISLFPIQLCESAVLFVIGAVLIFGALKIKNFPTIEVYFVIYGASRFILEFFRGDYRGAVFIFSISQWISIFFVIIGIYMMIVYGKKIRHNSDISQSDSH